MQKCFVAFFITLFSKCFADFVIDMDDILSTNYMPMSLLMLENPENTEKKFVNKTFEPKSKIDAFKGQFNDAYETMGFHRKMMNEYLCRNFIAEQIVADLTLTRIKRRLGSQLNNFDNSTKMPSVTKELRTNLIEDEGSNAYKNWLSKSTTLEDIYRHYDTDNGNRRDEDEEIKTEEEDYDAAAAGYGYAQKPHPYFDHAAAAAPQQYSGYAVVHETGQTGYGGGLGNYGQSAHAGYTGHTGYEAPPIHIHSGEHEQYHEHEVYEGKGKDLYKLYEIASTALAYLSFGMFLVQLCMCISLALNPTTTTMAAATGGGGMKMAETLFDNAGVIDSDTEYTDYTYTDKLFHDSFSEHPHKTKYSHLHKNDKNTQIENDTENNDDTLHTVNDYDNNGDVINEAGGGDTDDLIDEEHTIMDDDSVGDGTDMDAGQAEGLEDDPIYRMRTKRDIPFGGKAVNQETNELARRIIHSIEAAMVVPQDGGNCLRKILCENNSYSRTLKSNNKIWIPVWSLGMSWLSGKLSKGIPASTSVLDSIKASILGLGNANCNVIYQECDLKSERNKRRRRRRK